MLSIGIITAGGGYQYLTKEVSSGAEDYYIRAGAGSGEAQSWWLGGQQQAFGVNEALVREEQMKAFFGTKSDPETGERLGAKFRIYATVAERLAKAEKAHQRWVEADLATRAAALQTAQASEERWAESLAAHTVAASERWEKTRVKIERAGERNSVAGYDLTFSAPKSVSVLWASAPDTAAQGTVRAAHHEGVRAAMAVLERDGAFVRRGRNGVRQEKVSGVLAAAFDHRTSRTGDPQMHTHVAVLAMAKAGDGRVLALDGRAIYALSGALSAIYDFHRDKAMMRDLNVRFEVNERTGVREIAGVPGSLRELWSSRRAQITPRVEELKAQYLATHGRQAPPELVAKMAQWATLDTRPAKGEPESTEELFARWRAAASASTDTDLAEVWAAAVGREWLAPAATQTDQQIAETVMARLEAEKATWTVPNVMQMVWQVMERDPNTTTEEDEARAARVIDAVLARDDVLKLTPSLGLDLPPERVREDGEAVYQVHMAGRYATHSAVREEQYLVARCQSRTTAAVPVDRIESAIAAAGEPGLSDDQAAVVRAVAGSGADVNVIVGPAGTGKTSTMAVLAAAWQANGGSVLGLALSQTAANHLAAVTGGRAENIAKLLYETRRIDPEVFPSHAAKWRLRAGQLVIMDEAGMTDRAGMVAVARSCEQAGAKLVLVGDHEQLESPEARGAMRLMAKVAETFELGQVHRFACDWERDASLRLRAGDVEVLDEYAAHGRIYAGTAKVNEHRAVRLALADHLSGERVFILAGTNERAARVAGLFREGLVARGLVEPGGVRLGDGNLAGVGDRIVCRSNDRTLSTSRGSFVTNRSAYEVVARDTDGSLTVAVVDPATGMADRCDLVALPGAYVASSVVLEYAGTTHAAQGGTRFASHALISERDSINGVYVAMTRGWHSNLAHVDSDVEAGQDSEPRGQDPITQDPVAVLARILGREDDAEAVSALEARDLEVEKSQSLRTLFPIWQDLEGEHVKARWLAGLSQERGISFASRLTGSPAWPTLAARLADIEASGDDPNTALRAAVDGRGLDDAVDLAAVLHHRLESHGPERHSGSTDRDSGLSAPFSNRDLCDTAYAPAMRQIAERMDQRIVDLGERAAQNPPQWAAALGPVPADAVGRMEWTDRAATVASYREAFGVKGGDPIGESPPPARPEARRWWNAAREALAGDQSPAPWASDEELAERVAAGDRAEMERPDPARLEEAAKTERDRRAELIFALARQRVLDANQHATSEELADADGWMSSARPQAEQAARKLSEAEARHDAYRAWEARTAATRADAEAARKELARRVVPGNGRGDLADLPTGWVAYQAVQAERLLARKERALASARNAIQRVVARAESRDDISTTEANRTLLERWRADQARLEGEIEAARIAVEQINNDLDHRPDGQEAKAEAMATPTGRIPSQPAATLPRAVPGARQRPPTPTVS